VRLRDGGAVRIRPVRPEDEARLTRLYEGLSDHSSYQRFFTVLRRLPPDWAHFLANVDYRRRLALVAETRGPGPPEIVGVGRYEAASSDVPEVAFVVQDAWQSRGLGTVLLQDVVGAGAARGYARFQAYVLADNARMLGLLRRFTDVRETTAQGPVKVVVFAPRAADAAPA
jgi:RimJ/RimL family protein N-acetyltransferase